MPDVAQPVLTGDDGVGAATEGTWCGEVLLAQF